ncbi:hypothetical protein ESY86_12400 [Subsaximicrobium wynnwilliamsii]|uniref:Uncharacterized protein n=1 Tax=Subsaximicrobium wynnwilliamsii TaxID=291179 RepID=A0A5C6ZFB3_9FLAO|nr:AsmA-like C-terminal region-containing protein [Subsaximicrobium wynnwilliamsii]TXD82812.1 hypothetical protein ESY87_12435 [Subsaximicrobium wynnwilliamsii]TXD88535.1 hypothetical protein ESY86_12400 [Subsaximicrobium wynnwilliamsii]TXE02468.1 hypothetical protein ESY88_11965 [Subsaximicrobium wynnwilliamsii]
MQNPEPRQNKSTSLKWRKRILVALAVLILFPTALFTIGWFNRDTVIDALQDWYGENSSGTLTIGKVNASFISGFPKVGFTLKDIEQTSTDTILDKFSSINIEEAKIVIGAGNLLSGNIKIESIRLKNAVISSEVISKKSLGYHQQLKRDKANKKHKGIIMPEWLHADGVKFVLENITYVTKDSILNKYFNLDIHKIEGSYKGNKNQLLGNLFMDVTVNNLGFNTKKGSYFNGARVTGSPDFTIDLENDSISLPEFLFKVDAQNFDLSANFDFSSSNHYEFKLQNLKTNFNATKGLLPDSLAAKVAKFDIQKPFETKLQLRGKFTYGNNPDLEIHFSTDSNAVNVGQKIHLKNTSFSGNLTNDIYETDSLRDAKRTVKDLKVTFNNLNADLGAIKVDINNSYYKSTPETLNFIKAQINLNGSNEALAKLIEMDNFDFEGGTFQLNAVISGDINTPSEFINKATGHFNLANTRVVLKKNGLQLPLETIDVSLEREHSTLRQLIVNLPNGEDLVLKGSLKNIAGLLSKNPTTPTTSSISLNSKRLNINNIIALSKQFIPKSQKNRDDRKTLHEILNAVYKQFHPSFDINVDALTFNDFTINDLRSHIDLVDSKTILMRSFDFDYYGAFTSLKGSVVLPENNLKDAIYINAEATSRGNISVFEQLFDIQLFRFDAGDYQFHGNVKGNVKEFNEILNNAEGDFTLTNTKLHYPPANMDIDIDSLALFVDNADLHLKKFNLEIGELYPIKLSGKITGFPKFLMDDAQDSAAIFLKINAPFIDSNTWLTTLNSLKYDDKLKTPKGNSGMFRLFKDLNTFNPEIEIEIDSLKYKDLITDQLKAKVYFENDSILKLNNLSLNYKQTTANISGKVKAHIAQLDTLDTNPFDLDVLVSVDGKSEDLNDYLKTKNFIFKSGDFEFKWHYKAQSKNLEIVNPTGSGDLKISNTLVDYTAAGLQIPVDSLHIAIDNDVARLKTLDIDLPGKSSVFFSGAINQFSNFINNDRDEKVHSSNFLIYSPYLDDSDIKAFFANASSRTKKQNADEGALKTFKKALVGINSSFYPTATVKIDTLRHDDLQVTNFGIQLLFDHRGNFEIQDTHLNFYGGSLALNVDVGLQAKNDIPINMEMRADAINLNELVSQLNYFNDDALRNAEKIEGTLNFNIETIGKLNYDGKVDMNSLNGKLHLDLSNFKLYNYKPIVENSVLMKDERFEKLSFRPIVQTFEIRNGEIIIPRTEIQSSAIHFFAEGRFKLNEYMNVWLSLPWKNLKSNDGLTLPEKTTFANAGSKFYLQLVQDKTEEKEKNRDLKVKFRLSNRKLGKMKQAQN